MSTPTPRPLVFEAPAVSPEAAAAHFRERLALTTDAADVRAELQSGDPSFVLVDARSAENFAKVHVPGAISFPHRTITAESAARLLPRGKPVVTYCDGVHCNASTKAAAKLAALGYRVKEMLDGLEGWRKDGFPLAQGPA